MYEPIVFPLLVPLRDTDKKSIQRFFDWFVATIPMRLKILEDAVRSDALTSEWQADFSPESLNSLGGWYVRRISTRPLTKTEEASLHRKPTIPAEVEDWELDEVTYSIAVDVGIYLAEALRTHCEQLKWDVVLKDKRFVDYGCPVITGFGRAVMNPMRICAVAARGIVRGVANEERLYELYQTWWKLAQSKNE